MIGIIEGFFGRQWSWQARADYAAFLKAHDYQYYLYAPKGDTFLRQNWPDPWPEETIENLRRLRDAYREAGLAWGIGLNLYELHFHFDQGVMRQLELKLRHLNALEPDILAILFDDMKGDHDRIAQIQTEATHRAAELTTADTVIMCPTYYSDDPMLDRLFGQRPPDYLQNLGKSLDPAIRIFWTGPDVCSSAYPTDHLQSVEERLGRKPFLWDNYPVNDSEKMCRHLHLRAFTGRPHQMSQHIAGHAINPMNQALLSQIPLATLTESYQRKEDYHPDQALRNAVHSLCGDELGSALLEDVPLFHDQGLDQLEEGQKAGLIEKYEAFHSPLGEEVAGWLRGEYPYSPECLTE